MTLASFAEYSCSAAIAFSALLSCDTPTMALRTKIVRIWWILELVPFRGIIIAYDCRVYKGCPATIFFKKGEDKRNRCRTEENDD